MRGNGQLDIVVFLRFFAELAETLVRAVRMSISYDKAR